MLDVFMQLWNQAGFAGMQATVDIFQRYSTDRAFVEEDTRSSVRPSKREKNPRFVTESAETIVNVEDEQKEQAA